MKKFLVIILMLLSFHSYVWGDECHTLDLTDIWSSQFASRISASQQSCELIVEGLDNKPIYVELLSAAHVKNISGDVRSTGTVFSHGEAINWSDGTQWRKEIEQVFYMEREQSDACESNLDSLIKTIKEPDSFDECNAACADVDCKSFHVRRKNNVLENDGRCNLYSIECTYQDEDFWVAHLPSVYYAQPESISSDLVPVVPKGPSSILNYAYIDRGGDESELAKDLNEEGTKEEGKPKLNFLAKNDTPSSADSDLDSNSTLNADSNGDAKESGDQGVVENANRSSVDGVLASADSTTNPSLRVKRTAQETSTKNIVENDTPRLADSDLDSNSTPNADSKGNAEEAGDQDVVGNPNRSSVHGVLASADSTTNPSLRVNRTAQETSAKNIVGNNTPRLADSGLDSNSTLSADSNGTEEETGDEGVVENANRSSVDGELASNDSNTNTRQRVISTAHETSTKNIVENDTPSLADSGLDSNSTPNADANGNLEESGDQGILGNANRSSVDGELASADSTTKPNPRVNSTTQETSTKNIVENDTPRLADSDLGSNSNPNADSKGKAEEEVGDQGVVGNPNRSSVDVILVSNDSTTKPNPRVNSTAQETSTKNIVENDTPRLADSGLDSNSTPNADSKGNAEEAGDQGVVGNANRSSVDVMLVSNDLTTKPNPRVNSTTQELSTKITVGNDTPRLADSDLGSNSNPNADSNGNAEEAGDQAFVGNDNRSSVDGVLASADSTTNPSLRVNRTAQETSTKIHVGNDAPSLMDKNKMSNLVSTSKPLKGLISEAPFEVLSLIAIIASVTVVAGSLLENSVFGKAPSLSKSVKSSPRKVMQELGFQFVGELGGIALQRDKPNKSKAGKDKTMQEMGFRFKGALGVMSVDDSMPRAVNLCQEAAGEFSLDWKYSASLGRFAILGKKLN